MSVNLSDIFRETAGNEFATQVGSTLRVPTELASELLSDVLSSLSAAMIKKAEEEKGSSGIVDFLTTHGLQGELLTSMDKHFESIQKSNQLQLTGNTVLNFLFNRSSGILDDLLDVITNRSSASRATITSMIKLIGPLYLSLFGKEIKERDLDIHGVGQLIQEQKPYLRHDAPADLLAKFHLSAAQAPAKVEQTAPPVVTTSDQEEDHDDTSTSTGPGKVRRLIPWFILVSTAALLWYVMDSCGGLPRDEEGQVIEESASPNSATAPEKSSPDEMASKKSPTPAKDTRQVEGGVVKIVLPNGRLLETTENSSVDALYQYIVSSSFDPDRQFVIGSVQFKTDTLVPSTSMDQELKAIADLLDAYSSVHLRISSYTDDRGNGNRNLTISERRALTVKREINGLGVSIERLSSAGHGETDPVADNGTEEGRSANNRIALTVLKK